ncbi:hypothetical protein AB0I60_29930 [Actinosynnema sp. NPDC050436]|uniref:hypothetical protein n=1 Tax=Actinosynnema sp. NPDC050436 TaxID=3155659 RepID=UPI0033FE067B
MAVGGISEGLAGMSHAVQGFRAATAAGFAISAQGGRALLDAIEAMQAELSVALSDASLLAQEPPLGTTPAARVYRPFLASIAGDPAQGFYPALQRLSQDLTQLAADVRQSMDLYETTEDDNTYDLKSAGGSVNSA